MFGHPSQSGVYAICAKQNFNSAEHVIYIGSTKNLKQRLASPVHPYRVAYQRFPVYVRFFECENPYELEKELIKKYKPIMNKHHNG